MTATSSRPTSRRPSARARHAAKLRADGLTWRQVGAALRPPCGVRQAQRLAALAARTPADPAREPKDAAAQADATIQAAINDGSIGGRHPTDRVRFISLPSDGYGGGLQGHRYSTPPDEWLARRKRCPASELDADLVRMHPPPDYQDAVPTKGRLIEPRLVARHLDAGWTVAQPATQPATAEAA